MLGGLSSFGVSFIGCFTVGVVVDEELHEDLVATVRENASRVNDTHPPDSFARLFWEQQTKASSLKVCVRMYMSALLCVWSLFPYLNQPRMYCNVCSVG